MISIHAHTRGATIDASRSCPVERNFNPRSHKGSDAKMVILANKNRISIHAPTRGATQRIVDCFR